MIYTITKILVAFIAFIHIYIFVFEAFLWESRGPKIFRSFDKELFPKTKAMAQNQGVYNLFLALGLIWSLLIKDAVWQNNVALFFLGCVAIAGIVGAFTADKKILFVQTVPATIAMVLILLF